MPFTPLHMGPGIAVKSVMHRKLSLVIFGWSQIVIDIQPLVSMVTGEGELHGFSHTYIGATFIGIFCALSGKYLGEFFLRVTREQVHPHICWRVSFISAYIGVYSHVFIDSIMHSDIIPFAPFSKNNPMHGIISIEALHIWCVVSAGVGGLIYYAVERTGKNNSDPSND